MVNRLTGKVCRAALWLAALLMWPLLGLGQSYSISGITVKWKSDQDANEILSTGDLKSNYGYEMRVAIRKLGDSYTEIGTIREKAGSSLADFPLPEGSSDPLKYHKFGPQTYAAGDQVQLRWYDHVFTSIWRGSRSISQILNPVNVAVVIKNEQGTVRLNKTMIKTPSGSGRSGGGSPWPYNWEDIKKDAGAAIYTALNSQSETSPGDFNDFSFTLPIPEGGTTISIELTITVALKAVKSLKFVKNHDGAVFDGSARARMKSPGDVGFYDRSIRRIGKAPRQGFKPFFDAFPYPNILTEKEEGEVKDWSEYKKITEGWMLVVEDRGVAAEGVCVDGRNNARKVKIQNLADPGTPENMSVRNDRAVAKEPAWDGYGKGADDYYWLVPLRARGETIEVMPGACPGEMISVQYEAAGDGYSNLQLYRDKQCISKPVANGDEVESGRPLYAKLSRTGSSGCESFRLLWNVDGDPVEGKPCDLKEAVGSEKTYSFVPEGTVGQRVKVWGSVERQARTEVIWEDAEYEIKQGADVVMSGSTVGCGMVVTVNRKQANERGDLEKVEVWVNGTRIGEIAWDDKKAKWRPLDVTVVGKRAEFKFTPIPFSKVKIDWGVKPGSGYSLKVVKLDGGNEIPISPGDFVVKGSKVVITVAPGITGQRVRSIKAKSSGGGEVNGGTFDSDKNTLTIDGLTEDITAIQVELELIKLYRVTFADKAGVYTVSLAKKEEPSTPLVSPVVELSGTVLTVTVRVDNPARDKVVSINGDAQVISSKAGQYTYEFTVSADVQVTVELEGLKYKVNFSAAGGDVEEKEVWKGEKDEAKGGEKLSSGDSVNYGAVLYVCAKVSTGGASLGVEKVEAQYKGGSLVSFVSEGDDWYKLQEGVTGEIEEIVVTVLKLAGGEVFLEYVGAAKGAEEQKPFGVAKGYMRLGCNGIPFKAGEKHRVSINDEIQWESVENLNAGVGLDRITPLFLTVDGYFNEKLALKGKQGKFKLDAVLSEELKKQIETHTKTSLKLEMYISMRLDSDPRVVLYVQDSEPLGRLVVKKRAAVIDTLKPGGSYLMPGESSVWVTAQAKEPMRLEWVRLERDSENKEDLGMELGVEKEVKLPAYSSESDNRVVLRARFVPAGADVSLLTLRVNDAAGGELTAMRTTISETLESGKSYQKGLNVEVKARAREGYYLQRVECNGVEKFNNLDQDTVRKLYTFKRRLEKKEEVVTAYFASARAGKADGVEGAVWHGVTLFPNPTDGDVCVRGAGVVARYSVFDVAGRELVHGGHDGGEVLRIDFRALASGYYVVRLYSAAGEAKSLGVLRR